MALELVQYEKELREMAVIINDVFGIEMIIIDRWLYTLINTFDYGDNPVDVKFNSVVGSIIVSGKPQLIRNRTESEACSTCLDYNRCEMEGVIGVPINHEGICIGVVAVLVRKSNTFLFNKAQNIFELLTKFSDILVKSFEYDTVSDAVKEIKSLITEPFNEIDEPIVFLSKTNNILSVNNAFCEFFSLDRENIIEKELSETIKANRVSKGKQIRVGELFTGSSYMTAQVDAIKEYSLDVWALDRIVYFKKKTPNMFLDRPLAYRADEKMNRFWGPSVEMQYAKEMAMNAINNSLPVLIEGPSVSQNRELMKIVSRYGPEVDNIPAIIECSIEADELEHLLFGDQIENPGHLWPASSPAICLASIDRMSQYLQQKILDFVLKQRDNPKIIKKLRIFATSTRDLKDLVDRGLFLNDFLQILKQNYIVIPDIKNSYEDREYYLKRYLNDYCKIYKHQEFKMDEEFLNSFLQDNYLTKLQFIHEAAEFFVMNVEGNKLDLASWCLWKNHVNEKNTEEDDLGIVQLKVLLEAGFSKKKIAEKMGISRATLYRWLKHLEED